MNDELRREFSRLMHKVYGNGDYDKTKQLSISLIKRQKKIIDLLVENELEKSRSEFIRKAVDFYLIHSLQLLDDTKTIFERFITKRIIRKLD